MATKKSKHYTVNNSKRTIVVEMDKLTDAERKDVQFLASIGYQVSTKVSRPKSKGKNKAFYLSTLTIQADKDKFEEICRAKKSETNEAGFMMAVKWMRDNKKGCFASKDAAAVK